MKNFHSLTLIFLLCACGGGGGVGSPDSTSIVSPTDVSMNSPDGGSTASVSTFDTSIFDTALLATERNLGNFDSANFE